MSNQVVMVLAKGMEMVMMMMVTMVMMMMMVMVMVMMMMIVMMMTMKVVEGDVSSVAAQADMLRVEGEYGGEGV